VVTEGPTFAASVTGSHPLDGRGRAAREFAVVMALTAVLAAWGKYIAAVRQLQGVA
jgi:hypothetical protein